METPRKSMALGSPDSHTPDTDTFSTLPESVIFLIFSFLDPNQTVRLSLISKKFRRLCFNSPYLYFSADFDSSINSFARYTQFCRYVDNVMKLRVTSGIGIDRFLFHWFCKEPKYNVGATVLGSYLKIATASNVRELDILVCSYRLPHCVYECQSLRVLRLNLQMGNFSLECRKMDFVEVFMLDSASVFYSNFGEKISIFWTSLRILNLDKVSLGGNINMEISSLEELKLSYCEAVAEAGMCFTDWSWSLSITSSSLESLSIFKCHFKAPCRINLDCPYLKNFTVFGSDFDRCSTFKISSQSLDNFGICSSNFEKYCCSLISCPYVKQMKIKGCKFEEFCHLKTNSLSLDVLTVSDCEFIYPDKRSSESEPHRRINLFAERLQTLTINTSDKYSYKFPLSINASNLEAIIWKGNPVDFSYLRSFMSVENARIDIQPSCQHKSKELASHCKLFMSSIYSVAVLLQSLKDAKFLEINMWPIELFFMKNDEPIIFKNLLHLYLLVNDLLTDQLPGIASFLKGLPNLITLMIKCEKISSLLCDPDLINLLDLCPKTFTVALSEDSKQLKVVRTRCR